MFGMATTEGMSMENMNSLPLEQSMTVSDVDWKNDLYNVIAEDEKQFTALSEEDAEFEDPKALYEQSWGMYFAERSGAMGDISGTSTFRPQFSSPNPFTRVQIRSMPQTPPERLSNSFLNRSHSAPPTLPSKMKKSTYYTRLNKWHLRSSEEEEEEEEEDVTKLSLEDLMSPNQQNRNENDISPNLYGEINNLSPINTNDTDDDHKTNSVCVSNLLPQFEDCSLDDIENENSTELHDAIQSAIERRRSFEPDIVINQNRSMISSNTSNIQTTVNDNDILTLKMSDIKQFHRFIQFYVDPQRMNSQNIDDINQECCALLERYVSILQDINSDDVITQTLWFNRNTNQCTFHLLTNCDSNEANNNDNQTKKWCQIFLSIFESSSWIQSNKNEIVFSQLTPQ